MKMTSKQRKTRRFVPALYGGLAMAFLCAGARPAHAVNADPKDYVALPDGTNLFVQYLQFSHSNGLNVIGAGNQRGNLNSQVGISRFIHYTSIFGITVDPQVLIPYGTINSVNIGGQQQPSSVGFGSPIIAATIWPINIPKYSTYLGITPLITLPIGTYDRNRPINIGSHAYQFDLQTGFQTAFGSAGWRKNVILAIYGDWYKYGSQRNQGRLASQKDSGQVQTWLTANLDAVSNVSFGYSATFGGRQYSDGQFTGLATNVQRVRFEYQRFVTKRLQLLGEVTHDVHTEGGFKQLIGINTRLAYVF